MGPGLIKMASGHTREGSQDVEYPVGLVVESTVAAATSRPVDARLLEPEGDVLRRIKTDLAREILKFLGGWWTSGESDVYVQDVITELLSLPFIKWLAGPTIQLDLRWYDLEQRPVDVKAVLTMKPRLERLAETLLFDEECHGSVSLGHLEFKDPTSLGAAGAKGDGDSSNHHYSCTDSNFIIRMLYLDSY